MVLFTTEFWYYAPILASLTVTIAGAINGKLNLKGIWSQIVAWITGSILTIGGCFLGLIPVVGEPAWLAVICLCGVVGLSSNGIYDIPYIKNIINKMRDNV